MLEKRGTNDAGWQFWRIAVPVEHAPGGLEIGIHTDHHGLAIGDGHITWDEIDEARALLSVNATGSNRDAEND